MSNCSVNSSNGSACAGDWDRPVSDDAQAYEAGVLESFADWWKQGRIYRGLKPVLLVYDVRDGAGGSGDRISRA